MLQQNTDGMRSKEKIGWDAVDAIQTAIEDAVTSGKQLDAVFLGTDLRYIIAALNGTPLRFSMEHGEMIFGVKVIRYMTDDLTQFFLAASFPASPGASVNPIHRPYLRNPERKQDELR